MKRKVMALIVIVGFLIGTIFVGCGGGDSGGGGGDITPTPSPTTTQTPTPTPTTTQTPTPSPTATPSSTAYAMETIDVVSSGDCVMDNSDYAKWDSKTVSVPPEPSSPPIIPSATGYTLDTKTITYGYMTIDLFVYAYRDGKLEWIETETYAGTKLSTQYFQASAPTIESGKTARTFNYSRWAAKDGSLLAYGEGASKVDPITMVGEFSGTQVIKGKNQTYAFSYSYIKNADSSITGNLEYQNGATGTFSRSAPNENATTPSEVYFTSQAQVKGANINITWERTVYGDNSQKTVRTGTLFVVTHNFNPDGSGTGTIYNNTTHNTSTTTWDSSGVGTLTTSTGATLPYYVYVPIFFRY